jgi:hypothetical protein
MGGHSLSSLYNLHISVARRKLRFNLQLEEEEREEKDLKRFSDMDD